MFIRPFRTAAIGLCALGASLLSGNTAGAQTGVATPPEVTVDLSVLDSVSPPHHRPVVLHQPRERHEAAKKKPAPVKKAVAKPAKPIKKAEAKSAPRDEQRRAEAAERQWEADRKRDEARHQPITAERKTDMARIKEQEAERIRQAKAEIEAAARTAHDEPNDGERTPPPRTSTTIADPGAGPPTPPRPAITIESSPAPSKPPQVAAVAPPPSSPPAAAPAPVKPAAVAPKQQSDHGERFASNVPHIDFAAGTADLTPGARTELDTLARRLVADENLRVQLVAYATGSADEANQARRLSLSRALNVRAYLIDHGVRNTRMDVRALGNRAEGSKPTDRVVILLQGK